LKEKFKQEVFLHRDITQAIQRYFSTIKAVPQVQELLLQEVDKVRCEDDSLTFYHSVRDNVFHSAIWATKVMKRNLHDYGEIVLFDPTYLTSSLRLPFAFFLAVGGDGSTLVIAA